MELEQINKLDTVAETNHDVSIINFEGDEFSPYLIVDMDVDCRIDQRGITNDDRLVHLVDALIAGRYGYGVGAVGTLKLLLKRKEFMTLYSCLIKRLKKSYKTSKKTRKVISAG